MMIKYFQFFFVMLMLFMCSNTQYKVSKLKDTYVRINQVGYLINDVKRAIILSRKAIDHQVYSIIDINSNQSVFSEKIITPIAQKAQDSPFPFNYSIDFTPFNDEGTYYILLHDSTISHHFKIGDHLYGNIVDSLLRYLKVARCGDNDPDLHQPCHLYDATNVDLELTGGWHDAGDYLKFTEKEAYTTYTLLLSYDINTDHVDKFKDQDNNGMVDLLDEAKIGLNYLLKVYPDPKIFVSTVGNFDADHDEPLRLPEQDELAKNNRPAIFKFKRDELAKYAYTMALASKIFSQFVTTDSLSKIYLELSKRAYSRANEVGQGNNDKLCLAATELYLTTNEITYLDQAKSYNDLLSSRNWGHYSDNTNYAHARLAPFYPNALNKLKESIKKLHEISKQNLFGYDVAYKWGSLYVAISTATSSLFYSTISNDIMYSELDRNIKNYVLGLNPWGVSFISGVGTIYPKNIHNNVVRSLKRNGKLEHATITGAVAEGPFDRDMWKKKWSKLVPVDEDIYQYFHPANCVYHDHENDYVTNEPCIYGVSETILFFSTYL
jgi:endoglucanase